MARRSYTLRSRMLTGAAVVTAGALVASGLAVYISVRLALIAEFDGALLASARSLAAMTEQSGTRVKIEGDGADLPEFARAVAPDHFAAVTEDGRFIGGSAELAKQITPTGRSVEASPAFDATTLPSGAAGQRVIITFLPGLEDEERQAGVVRLRVTLAVVRETAGLTAQLRRLAFLLAGIAGAATLLAVIVMSLVVRRGLRPLNHLAGKIAGAGAANLRERIDLADAPGELVVVVRRLNALLDGVQSAFEREQRFTADVAHELRTPIAGLAAILDVCALRRREPAEYERAVARCLGIVRDMRGMVDHLLLLARSDAGRMEANPTPIDVATLVRDCWSSFEEAATARQLTTEFGLSAAEPALADAAQLRIVVNNLLDNAVSHADVGGWLRIECADAPGDRLTFRITNSGCKLTAAEAERVFDRFWRGDAARHDANLHSGLGLSLCRQIVIVQGGAITATATPAGLFTIAVVLPVASLPCIGSAA